MFRSLPSFQPWERGHRQQTVYKHITKQFNINKKASLTASLGYTVKQTKPQQNTNSTGYSYDLRRDKIMPTEIKSFRGRH